MHLDSPETTQHLFHPRSDIENAQYQELKKDLVARGYWLAKTEERLSLDAFSIKETWRSLIGPTHIIYLDS